MMTLALKDLRRYFEKISKCDITPSKVEGFQK
jgi:hypothetical protein